MTLLVWVGGVAAASSRPAAAAERAVADTTAPRVSFDTTGTIDGLPIRRVEVVPRNIYDPVPPGRLRALYRIANRLHVRTRASTIRQQLLFAPGEPWSHARGRETARLLRGLDILEPVRLDAVRRGDSVDVLIETRDTWTTSPEFNIESGGGMVFGAVSLVERNLLGMGKLAFATYREDPVAISRSLGYGDPAVLGTRARLSVAGATGSGGASQSVSLGVPFYAEDTRYSYGFDWNRRTYVARLFEQGREAANFDARHEAVQVYWGRGMKSPAGIVRLVASFSFQDRRFGPSRLEPGAPPDFAGDEENLKIHRLSGEMRVWRPDFIERTGVDRIEGIEDFDLGPSVRLIGGVSPEFLGGTADEGYAAARVDAGVRAGDAAFGLLHVDLSTVLRHQPRESIGKLEARWITQAVPRQTQVLALSGVVGARVPRDFQTIVGGLNGLRAYPVHALAGREVWRFNAESRWIAGRNYYQLFSLGAAVFYDAARAWGPGSGGVGWFHDAGVGLRISLPRSALDRIARLDVAWPISPTRDGRRNPFFSFGSSQAF